MTAHSAARWFQQLSKKHYNFSICLSRFNIHWCVLVFPQVLDSVMTRSAGQTAALNQVLFRSIQLTIVSHSRGTMLFADLKHDSHHRLPNCMYQHCASAVCPSHSTFYRKSYQHCSVPESNSVFGVHIETDQKGSCIPAPIIVLFPMLVTTSATCTERYCSGHVFIVCVRIYGHALPCSLYSSFDVVKDSTLDSSRCADFESHVPIRDLNRTLGLTTGKIAIHLIIAEIACS